MKVSLAPGETLTIILPDKREMDVWPVQIGEPAIDFGLRVRSTWDYGAGKFPDVTAEQVLYGYNITLVKE